MELVPDNRTSFHSENLQVFKSNTILKPKSPEKKSHFFYSFKKCVVQQEELKLM